MQIIICWLTGYSLTQLQKNDASFILQQFFTEAVNAPASRHLIKGSVCGVKIRETQDPIEKEMRYLDKLVDELAKGKPMEKILK